MKNKDFREIQVSSSLLVVIFLGVLALGVFIFLLGVNVGKKQTQIVSRTQVVSEPLAELVKEPAPVTAPEEQAAAKAPSTTAVKAPAPKATAQPAPEKAPAAAAPQPGSGLYYVQVAAFTERAQAAALADKYRKEGYTVVITDPRPAESRTWYRVRLGGYASRDRAVDLLNKLNAAEKRKTDYRVVQD